MSREAQEHRLRHGIELYKRKVGRDVAGFMYNRFDPSQNLSIQSFAFVLSINLNIVIDNNVILPPPTKARYGTARYGYDRYDPLAPIGILIPDQLTKQLYLFLIRHFMNATYRGYKYSLNTALQFLDASIQIFTKFAPEPVWVPRFRKVEAWRMWTSFFDLSCFDVSIFPADEVFIRVTDTPEDFGYPISPRTTRTDNLSSNLYDHGVWDRSFYTCVPAPYREIILLAPNLQCYEPVWDVANWDYDVFFDTVVFDPNALYDVIEHFKERQNPMYQQLTWFLSSERMKTMYAVQATWQQETLRRVLYKFRNVISSPLQISMIHAFAMEYGQQRKFMRLVESEKVIQKYVKLGVPESVLRGVAQVTQRK
jgi:hypothetical protein